MLLTDNLIELSQEINKHPYSDTVFLQLHNPCMFNKIVIVISCVAVHVGKFQSATYTL